MIQPPTKVQATRCATCDTEIQLTAPGYLRVRIEEEPPEGPPRYYCSRECLYETAHYAPEVYNAIRSATHKGGRGRV